VGGCAEEEVDEEEEEVDEEEEEEEAADTVGSGPFNRYLSVVVPVPVPVPVVVAVVVPVPVPVIVDSAEIVDRTTDGVLETAGAAAAGFGGITFGAENLFLIGCVG